MKRGTEWLRWRRIPRPVAAGAYSGFRGRLLRRRQRTGAEIEFESELIAIAKKAKSHMAFKQAMEDKIMEKHGFVVTRKPSAKGKKKVR